MVECPLGQITKKCSLYPVLIGKETHKALEFDLDCGLTGYKYVIVQRKKKKIDVIREADKLNNSITNKIKTSIRNFEMIPPIASIRFEYVKCGKSNCSKCSEKEYHGPYYFAYFRDKENCGKLRKKYIGIHDPRTEYFKEYACHLVNNANPIH